MAILYTNIHVKKKVIYDMICLEETTTFTKPSVVFISASNVLCRIIRKPRKSSLIYGC